jgi:hypothetical protein
MFWSIAIHAHCLFGGATLHRAALFATHRGDHALAERLFERGGERYRDEIQVQPLARLRVHQEIARLCAVQATPRDPELRADGRPGVAGVLAQERPRGCRILGRPSMRSSRLASPVRDISLALGYTANGRSSA